MRNMKIENETIWFVAIFGIIAIFVIVTVIVIASGDSGKSINQEHVEWANTACSESEGVKELVDQGVICRDGSALAWER